MLTQLALELIASGDLTTIVVKCFHYIKKSFFLCREFNKANFGEIHKVLTKWLHLC